jgi:hypothetical protein
MERLGWRLRLAGFKPDALERMTGIKERRMWEAGTTVVQVRGILDLFDWSHSLQVEHCFLHRNNSTGNICC